MAFNHELSGVFTRYESVAYGLCNALGTPFIHEEENHLPGYYNHFHFKKLGVKYKTHAWFVM